MAALGELLSYANKEEERLQKAEIEKRLFPLWLVNYAAAKIKGSGEVIGYDEFLKIVFSDSAIPNTPKKKKTAEEIMAQFAPIIAADKQKGG